MMIKENNKELENIFASTNLEKKGYFCNETGWYCPLIGDYYLKISRGEKKFEYFIVSYINDVCNYLSPAYSCKESITEDKDSRTKKLNQYWQKIDNSDIKPLLYKIATDLMNEGEKLVQINSSFNVYEDIKQSSNIDDSIEVTIENRRHPKLNDLEKNDAEYVKNQIMEIGFVNYLNNQLDKLHIGNHINIYRKLLGSFMIMCGEGSYLFETIAKAGEGKSLEDEIVFDILIPKEYVYKVNSITKSSFTRYADKNEYYFDRQILLFGDFGSQKSFTEMEDLLNILKVLITEKEYVRDLSDKSENGNYSNKQLKIKCESIGGAYSSVINGFTQGDSQLESRTISSTPCGAKEEDVLDFIIMLQYEDSIQNKEKQKAEIELKKFQNYLIKCVGMDLTIINPYGEVFKRYALHSDVPKRELKQILDLFNAYCKLTFFNCETINDCFVASENQLNEFMKDICLENALIPYESDFLKMLIAKGKKYELKIIDEDDENTNHLNIYYNEVLEILNCGNHQNFNSFADLNFNELNQAIKKLLRMYKIGGTSSEHKSNVFFRITDIRRYYSKYKAYKNIDDIQLLIQNLLKKGYIDKLEYKDGKQNIYYLTYQCYDINIPFELNDEDKRSSEYFLKKIGVVK